MNINKIKIFATEYDVEEVEQINKYERLLGEINYTEQKNKNRQSDSRRFKKRNFNS